MNFFALLSLLAGIMDFCLSLYVLRKNTRALTNRLFSLTAISLSIWCFGEAMQRASLTSESALFWTNYVMSWGSIFFPVFFLHFWLVFSEDIKYFKKIPVYLIYTPAFIFLLLRFIFPRLFVKEAILEYWGYSLVGGPLYGVIMFYVLIYPVVTLFLSVKFYLKSKSKKKNQTKYIIITLTSAILIGIFTQFIPKLLNIKAFGMTTLYTPFFITSIAYAIVKHGLMFIPLTMTAEKIIENIPEYVVATDRNRRIVFVNQQLIEALGYKREELINKRVNIILDYKWKFFDSKIVKETEIWTKNKEKILVSLSGSTINDKDGNVIGYILIMRDIAESKQLIKSLEEKTKELNEKIKESERTKAALLNIMEDLDETNKKLERAQKELKRSYRELKKLDIEKDKFISIAAHELKTPMSIIHGFVQLLQDEKIIENKEARDKYLKIVENEIKRLSKLVKDILELSRADIGTLRTTIEDVNIYNIIEEIKNTMEGRVREKGLEFILNISQNLPKIRTDVEKLKEVLINLIDNAIKYTEKGSIKVEVSLKDGNVRFSVTDTGIGIPKKYHKKIFSRFYQVESPLTRKTGGSGLGLSICKEYIKLLGGNIWFSSKVGKGTTFFFTLPLNYKKKE